MARIQYTDQQYYADHFGIDEWSATAQYLESEIVEHNPDPTGPSLYWQANVRPTLGVAPSATNNQWTSFTPPALGENRFITLEDTINNYMVLYGEDDVHGGTPSRNKIEPLS